MDLANCRVFIANDPEHALRGFGVVVYGVRVVSALQMRCCGTACAQSPSRATALRCRMDDLPVFVNRNASTWSVTASGRLRCPSRRVSACA